MNESTNNYDAHVDALSQWREILAARLRADNDAGERRPVAILITGPRMSGKTAVRHLIAEAFTDVGGCASIDAAEMRMRRIREPSRDANDDLAEQHVAEAAVDWLLRAAARQTSLVLEIDGKQCGRLADVIQFLARGDYHLLVVVVCGVVCNDVQPAAHRSPDATLDAAELQSIGDMLEQTEQLALATEIRFVDGRGITRNIVRPFPGNRVQRARSWWNSWAEKARARGLSVAKEGSLRSAELKSVDCQEFSRAEQKDIERRLSWQQLIHRAAEECRP